MKIRMRAQTKGGDVCIFADVVQAAGPEKCGMGFEVTANPATYSSCRVLPNDPNKAMLKLDKVEARRFARKLLDLTKEVGDAAG
jgi:hypothetical protein